MFALKDQRIGSALLPGLLLCTAASAQSTLETVTVWAQKREAELHDVPMSVTVLSADQLSMGGLGSIADVAQREPSLDLQNSVSATTTSLRIRRIGSLGNIPTFEPAVGLFIDGAFRSRSLLAASDFIDVERIEILRGPQSTLYGKNTSAGVVALYTQRPDAKLSGSMEATSGWIDTEGSPTLSDFEARIRGPLTSTLGASVAASYAAHGHTLSNELADGPDGNDSKRLAFRGQLAWSPSDVFDTRLLVGYAREDDDQGESDVVLTAGAPSTTVAGVLQNASLATECPDNVPHNRRSCAVATNTFDFEAIDVTLLSSYRMTNGWTLTSVTSWDRYDAFRTENDIGQLFAPIMLFNDTERGASVQEELRLTSAEGESVSWLAGLFYYRHDYERGGGGKLPMFAPNGEAAFHPIWATLLRGTPLALPGQAGVHQSHLDTRYVSAFGDVTWKLTDRLSLTSGLRWQREEKHAGINNSLTAPGASLIANTLTPTVSPTGEPVNGTIKRDSDNVTWAVTPQYRINDDVMAYVEFARGAKSGGFNTGFGNAPLTEREFGDEHIQHYELGSRGRFAKGNARLSAAAFYTEYRDYQDAAFVAAQFSVGNADRVVLQGLEVEGLVQLAPGFIADVSISLADVTYAKNTTGACYPGRTPDGTAPRSCNLAGEHPINAPLWTTHIGLQRQYAVHWGEIYGRLDWSWSDEYNTSFSADPRLVQNDFSDIGVRIGARVGASYEVVLWAENLLDERVTTIDAVLNLFNDTSYQSFLTAPRSYGATVRMHF